MTEERKATPIDELAEKWVSDLAAVYPTLATYIGYPSRLGEYDDYSPAGHEQAAALVRATLSELKKLEPLDDVDRVTKRELERDLELSVDKYEAGFHEWDLNVLASPPQSIRNIYDLMPTASESDWENVASRLNNVAVALSGYQETLRVGIAKQNTPAKRQVLEVIKQVTEYAKPGGFFDNFVANAPVADSLKQDLYAGAKSAAESYGKLAEFLQTELLPAAREKDGVGRELYQIASRGFLGTTIDLEETYEWGKAELGRMIAEQESIANEILPGSSVAEAIAHLEKNAAHKLHGTDALQKWMQETSDQAIADLSKTHFDIAEPIKKLECMIAPTQEGGIYYTGPNDDFSRPGRMWWSVPQGVTEFDTWREKTTVYHEGVPGHHLQIAQAVYNRAQLNSYRRLLAGVSGHFEGWALYAERLMAELGYLDNPADRLGMLDGQRMRAARVVLDIGVHLGKDNLEGTGVWDANYALDFFGKNCNMNEGFVKFEVNRYLGWPGQAPSYKIGQRIWEDIRDSYKSREGSAFDAKKFHMKALNLGSVGLDTLQYALLEL